MRGVPLCAPRFSLSTEGRVGHPSFFARGWRPSALPMRGAGPLRPPGVYAGLAAPATTDARRGCAPSSALLPMGRALRPSTPGDFPVAGKVTKGAPRAAPFGIPRCVVAALFALAALRSAPSRAGLPSATKIDRFATLSWWANRSLFLLKLHRGSHPLLSIRGAAGMPSRMLEVLSYREQYR